jgi:hypothetical protein
MTNPSYSAVGSEKMRFCTQKLLRKHQKHVLKQFFEPDLTEPTDSGNRVRFGVLERGRQRTGSGTQPHAPALLESA